MSKRLLRGAAWMLVPILTSATIWAMLACRATNDRTPADAIRELARIPLKWNNKNEAALCVAFSAKGHVAVGTMQGSLWLWNVKDGKAPVRLVKPETHVKDGDVEWPPRGPIGAVAFSPDSKSVI